MKVLILVLILYCPSTFAQSPQISKEEFVNEIFNKVADSNFSKYYLLDKAYPCNFKRYNYDEWAKYGLKNDVSINVLNELSEKSYLDSTHNSWIQGKLSKAICIADNEADTILNPVLELQHNKQITGRKKRKAIKKQLEVWAKKPEEEKFVFCISKPEFTDDFQYAVINVVYRCDDKACGMGATYVFKRIDNNWEVAGKMIAWGN